VGLFVAGTPLVFAGPAPVYVLAVAFVLINAGAKIRRLWPGIHAARPESWGTVAMPLALIPVLAVTWSVDPSRLYILQAAFLILALADPLASWVGEAMGKQEWVPGATRLGSATFAGSAFVLGAGVLLVAGTWEGLRAVGGAVGVAVAATAVEAIGRSGWDNLFVVLAVLLVLVPLHEAEMSVWGLWLSIAAGAGFGGAARVAGALAPRGAVGGGLFAFSLVGVGGWAWALPGGVFFVLSSLLSAVRAPSEEGDGGEGTERTLPQVMANGGVAWLLLFVSAVLPPDLLSLRAGCYAGFLGALAAAAADTWATELGVQTAERPLSLRTATRVPAGESGAVSLGGTVAAALGAGSVAVVTVLPVDPPVQASWEALAAVVGAGLVGMGTDSLAGAFLQARYRDPASGRLVETAVGRSASPVRGWRGINNETVNLLGTTAGALAALLLL
jgi:uncharacterized protein (TIGR00297 family)